MGKHSKLEPKGHVEKATDAKGYEGKHRAEDKAPEQDGWAAGSRTVRPHHPKGWTSDR